jgi:hypothetical protein
VSWSRLWSRPARGRCTRRSCIAYPGRDEEKEQHLRSLASGKYLSSIPCLESSPDPNNVLHNDCGEEQQSLPKRRSACTAKEIVAGHHRGRGMIRPNIFTLAFFRSRISGQIRRIYKGTFRPEFRIWAYGPELYASAFYHAINRF